MSNYPGSEWAPDSVEQPAAQEVWPPGNYEGEFVGGELFSSQAKGTPGIRLKFNVRGNEVEVNCWLTEASSEMSINQLGVVGWNGDVANPEFFTEGPVKLYMKHGSYKGKLKYEWSVSTFDAKPPPSAGDPVLTRFAARFKNAIAAKKAPPTPPRPMPAPMQARPTAPLPAAAKPAAAAAPKAPPRPAPPPPPKAPAAPAPPQVQAGKHKAATQDEAWAAWVAEGQDNAEMFYDAVERVAGTNDPSAVTPEQWQEIADAGQTPF